MKKLILLTILTSGLNLHAKELESGLVCGQPLNDWTPASDSVQFAGPRFADHINLDLEAKDVIKFISKSDLAQGTLADIGSISISLAMGSCKKSDKPNTLVECDVNQANPSGSNWMMGRLDFTLYREVGSINKSHDTVNINRDLLITRLKLVVTQEMRWNSFVNKNQLFAVAKLRLAANLPDKNNVIINLVKPLGLMATESNPTDCRLE